MKRKNRKDRRTLLHKIAGVLMLYLKTQALIILATSVVVWLVLAYLGVRYAIVLALITGSLSVVPVLGLLTASFISAAVAVFDGVRFLPASPVILEGVAVLAVYGLLNLFLDYFLAPYLLSRVVQIHPVLVLISVLAGATVFGFVGALLAVPVLLILKTVAQEGR